MARTKPPPCAPVAPTTAMIFFSAMEFTSLDCPELNLTSLGDSTFAIAGLGGLVSGNLAAQSTYLGFDRNQYPGDENLKALRRDLRIRGLLAEHSSG